MPQAPDPYRLTVAAHELGHAVVWRAAGFDIDEIWVKGHGPAAHGHVWLTHTEDDIHTIADMRGAQAGQLAGPEAENLWCATTGETKTTYNDTDRQLYLARRRTPLGQQVSHGAARAEARRLLRAHWHTIVRLTPTLATTGRLSPSRLPRA